MTGTGVMWSRQSQASGSAAPAGIGEVMTGVGSTGGGRYPRGSEVGKAHAIRASAKKSRMLDVGLHLVCWWGVGRGGGKGGDAVMLVMMPWSLWLLSWWWWLSNGWKAVVDVVVVVAGGCFVLWSLLGCFECVNLHAHLFASACVHVHVKVENL